MPGPLASTRTRVVVGALPGPGCLLPKQGQLLGPLLLPRVLLLPLGITPLLRCDPFLGPVGRRADEGLDVLVVDHFLFPTSLQKSDLFPFPWLLTRLILLYTFIFFPGSLVQTLSIIHTLRLPNLHLELVSLHLILSSHIQMLIQHHYFHNTQHLKCDISETQFCSS